MAEPRKSCNLIVLTGGPGAGKTAILEVVRWGFFENVAVLPEAASMILSSEFWRQDGDLMKKGAQRAIFHVQRELERAVSDAGLSQVALCDRGTVDGLAYWPNSDESFWRELGSTREDELKRYAAVIHLRTPKEGHGYDHRNPVRIETAKQAARVDEKIGKAWEGHPNRVIVESTPNFLEKVRLTLDEIGKQIARLQ